MKIVQVYLSLKTYIEDAANYDEEIFYERLMFATEKYEFDVNYKYASFEELKAGHISEENYLVTYENLFHVAIQSGNYSAAIALVKFNVDPFKDKILKKMNAIIGKYAKSIDTKRVETIDLLADLDFRHAKYHDLITTIVHYEIKNDVVEANIDRLVQHDLLDADHRQQLSPYYDFNKATTDDDGNDREPYREEMSIAERYNEAGIEYDEDNPVKMSNRKYSLERKLGKRVDDLKDASESLEDNWPENEKTFKRLSGKFKKEVGKFREALSNYKQIKRDIKDFNEEVAGEYEVDVTWAVDKHTYEEYEKQLRKAQRLITIETVINTPGFVCYGSRPNSNQNVNRIKKINRNLLADPIPNAILAQEYKMQKYVNEKFFRVDKNCNLKPGKPSKEIYDACMALIEFKRIDPISLDGYSARSVIVGLAKILQKNARFPTSLTFSLGKTLLILEKGKDSSFQAGNMKVICKSMLPKEKIYIPSEYGESIYNYLKLITDEDTEREAYLAKMMQRKTAELAPFDYSDFNVNLEIALEGETRINLKDIGNKQTEILNKHIHFLNQLIFLRGIFENVRRLYRDANGNTHNKHFALTKRSEEVPVSCLQARASLLLQRGQITLQDYYGSSQNVNPVKLQLNTGASCLYEYNPEEDRAIYGIVTGKTSNQLGSADWKEHKEKKVALIDKKAELLNSKYLSSFSILGKRKKVDKPTDVKDMYKELKDEYGSGGESCDSDSDYSNKQNKYK